jgi:transcriptional regulator with XRE-family HTH domain
VTAALPTQRQRGIDTAQSLGARLREIRQQHGLSLSGVEAASGGVWKAVVVGSYERGDRTITVPKLIALAEFYGIPVWRLFPGSQAAAEAPVAERLVIDMGVLSSVPMSVGGPLARYLESIAARRGDRNGRVLTLRADDVVALSALYDLTAGEFVALLRQWKLIRTPSAVHHDGEPKPASP